MWPSRRHRVLALVVVAAVAAAIGGVGVGLLPDRFTYPDAFHYAEMGRQLERGEGFTSLQGYWYLLAWLRRHGLSIAPPWPNVTRFPLITLVYGLAFRLAGPSVTVAKLVGVACFTATAMTACALGTRLFGVAVGVLAAMVFATSLAQVVLATSGLLETGAALFLVATTLALVATLDSRGRWPPLVLGVLAGLAFLWRYDLLVLLPAAAAVLALRRDRASWSALGWMGLGFAVAVGPWVGRNLWLFHTPLPMLAIDRNLTLVPGRVDPYASTTPVDVVGLLTDPAFLRQKAETLVWPLVRWRSLFGPHLAWLGPATLAAGLVLRRRHRPALAAWAFVLLAWMLRVALLSLMHHEIRFYRSFTPVCLVLAVGAAALLLRRTSSSLRVAGALAVAALVVLGMVDLGGWAAQLRRIAPLPMRYAEVFREVGARTRPGTIVASRRNAALVAWYADRFVVQATAGGITRLEAQGLHIGAALHRTRDTAWVRRRLRAQHLEGRFVPVPIRRDWTLWLRPEAASAAADAGARP